MLKEASNKSTVWEPSSLVMLRPTLVDATILQVPYSLVKTEDYIFSM